MGLLCPLGLMGVQPDLWGGEWAGKLTQRSSEEGRELGPPTTASSHAQTTDHRPQGHRALCFAQLKIHQALLYNEKFEATLLKWTHAQGELWLQFGDSL